MPKPYGTNPSESNPRESRRDVRSTTLAQENPGIASEYHMNSSISYVWYTTRYLFTFSLRKATSNDLVIIYYNYVYLNEST